MKGPTHAGTSRPGKHDVTRLLNEFQGGDRAAFDQVFVIVYAELRRLAQRHLSGEAHRHTLLATALVNEAYLKLVGSPAAEWHGRAHFFSAASRAMREILVDYARRRQARKRGGRQRQTTLDEHHAVAQMNPEELLALDSALDRLDAIDERLRKVVEYRFFCGFTDAQIADFMGMSTATVKRSWTKARAWLHKELYPLPENRDGA